jgi:ADP-ribose pyrophosphatase
MNQAWERYLTLMNQRPEEFANNGPLEIITDPNQVAKFEASTGQTIGVVYESKYHILVVDLVQQEEGEPFAYERLLPAVVRGAVVTLPFLEDKLVLLRQYRHALRQEQLSFPRGFAEEGLSSAQNAVKELVEELGCQVSSITPCGQIVADSGVDGTRTSVFVCQVKDLHLKPGYEGISNFELVTQEELEEMIRANQIQDGFTLAAFTLWKSRKNEG